MARLRASLASVIISCTTNSPRPKTPTMLRRHHAITLQQASEESPALARLTALTREPSARLKAIQTLIPAPLRPADTARPIEWSKGCLLERSNAAAAKIRQLLPALQAHLRSRGWEVNAIRLKVEN